MAYTLQALVSATGEHIKKSPDSKIVALSQDFEILLFTTSFTERNNFEILPLAGGSGELPETMADFCKSVSFGCVIAYIEAEYFGGTGVQASVIFKDAREDAQKIEPGAINLALKRLGVSTKAPFDEFASLNPGQYRRTDDW